MAQETHIKVETAIFYNGEFRAWQTIDVFPSREAAWSWLKARGYKATDKGDKFLAYPTDEPTDYPEGWRHA